MPEKEKKTSILLEKISTLAEDIKSKIEELEKMIPNGAMPMLSDELRISIKTLLLKMTTIKTIKAQSEEFNQMVHLFLQSIGEAPNEKIINILDSTAVSLKRLNKTIYHQNYKLKK